VIVRRNPGRVNKIAFSKKRRDKEEMTPEGMTPLAAMENVVARRPGDYDLGFMRRWARFMGQKPKNPFWSSTIERLPWLTLYLPYGAKETTKRWKWFNRAEDALNGDFADNHFVVAYAGDHTGDYTQDYLDKCILKTGAEWAAVLRNEAVPCLKMAIETERLSKKERQGNESVLCLQPVFDKPAIDAWENCKNNMAGEPYDDYLLNITMLPNDKVSIAAPGIGRTLEWWHFQAIAIKGEGNDKGPSWGSLLEELGFSQVTLRSADCPPSHLDDVKDNVFTGGIGYTQKHLAAQGNNTVGGEAENLPSEGSGHAAAKAKRVKKLLATRARKKSRPQ